MKIVNEIEEKIVKMQIDMTDNEIFNMVQYYDDNCSKDETITHKINWVINDILTKRINQDNEI